MGPYDEQCCSNYQTSYSLKVHKCVSFPLGYDLLVIRRWRLGITHLYAHPGPVTRAPTSNTYLYNTSMVLTGCTMFGVAYWLLYKQYKGFNSILVLYCTYIVLLCVLNKFQ